MVAPLKGIRVIDWTVFQQGPVASMMLADLGAEVIHIEHRVTGDPARGVKKLVGQAFGVDASRDYYFETNNRGKKSMTLDVNHPRGKEIIYRMVEKSDVFVQNFRQGVARRLQLDYGTLSKYNPKLVYGTASGYGPKGPHAEWASYDILGQARSGLMYLCAERGCPPQYISGGLADQMGSIILAYGILVALVARELHGVGQEVDASLLGSSMWLEGLAITASLATSDRQYPTWSRSESVNPLWNYYKCRDGKWICLGMSQSDRFWRDFCQALGIPELTNDPRFVDIDSREKHHRELIAILDQVFLSKSLTEWLDILEKPIGGLMTPVNTVSDLSKDPQVVANEYITEIDHPVHGRIKVVGLPVKFSVTPGIVSGVSPEFGQNTEEVLMDVCGYSWEEIEKLKTEEVI